MTKFRDHASADRYELEEDGATTFADYRDASDGVRAITHVETPAEARGKGTAKRLMDGVVTEARASGRKLRARCGYAIAYFQRYPEMTDVLD